MLADHSDHDRVFDLEPVTGVGEVLAAQAGVAVRARQRRPAPLHRRHPRGHPRGPAHRAGREPPRRPAAVSRRQGAGRAGGSRPRPARRRPGAGAGRAAAPAAARARGRRATIARPWCATRSTRCPRCDAGPRPPGQMRRAAGAASLGLAFVAAAVTFDTASLYLPAVALLVLSVGAAAWVRLAALGAGIRRIPGPHTVEEGKPYPLRLEVKAGVLPPPGGELTDPLLEEPVRIGGLSSRRVRMDVRFERRGPVGARARHADDPRSAGARRARGARLRRRPAPGGARASARGAPAQRGRPRLRRQRRGAEGARAAARARRFADACTARPRSSISTACAPTARARPRRASIGPWWRAAERWWSGA